MAIVTAKKLDVIKDSTNGNIVVPVQFFYDGQPGDKIFIPGNDLTEDIISEQCFFALKARQEREDAILLITTGDVTPKAPVVTEQEIFAQALLRLERLGNLSKLGIVIDAKESADALEAAQAAYKPGF